METGFHLVTVTNNEGFYSNSKHSAEFMCRFTKNRSFILSSFTEQPSLVDNSLETSSITTESHSSAPRDKSFPQIPKADEDASKAEEMGKMRQRDVDLPPLFCGNRREPEDGPSACKLCYARS